MKLKEKIVLFLTDALQQLITNNVLGQQAAAEEVSE
jgi:hypothetical protein